MKRHLSIVLLCASILGCAFAADKPADSARSEVLAVERARVAASVSHDVAVLDRILRDDLSYVHASGRIDTKKSLVDAIRSDELHYIAWTEKEIHVRLNRDTAIVDGGYGVKVINRKVSPEIADSDVLFLAVYVRDGGHWRLMAWQTTKDVRPAAGGKM